jgi:hypothetical protein
MITSHLVSVTSAVRHTFLIIIILHADYYYTSALHNLRRRVPEPRTEKANTALASN